MSETGRTRGQVLRAAAAGGAVLGAGAVLGGWVDPQLSAGRPSRAQDAQIFSFLLLLEQAQAAFYDAALGGGRLSGDHLQFAEVVAPQEHDHVDLLRREARHPGPAGARLRLPLRHVQRGGLCPGGDRPRGGGGGRYIGQAREPDADAMHGRGTLVVGRGPPSGVDPRPRRRRPGPARGRSRREERQGRPADCARRGTWMSDSRWRLDRDEALLEAIGDFGRRGRAFCAAPCSAAPRCSPRSPRRRVARARSPTSAS